MMLRAGAAERRISLGESLSWITVLRVPRICRPLALIRVIGSYYRDRTFL
ncbi:hypothetical protein NSU_0990 [Novosphingobium pentaromativorans US6-1]|uniref:Uncharacterized protein n=1 Tax=Novosphingobium pentaromativorans US6-1 TaxID=1088721 RepID=G6E9G9_9SPHN|nr:hypothetical protein NSU_0990 [Novosphingobium pentaromativorans US6-1]